ncbi:MAG: glycosyltransferase family 1 protein [Rubrivivax sp.]|nr:MAG: glycosyltransferase family 1 protein [Rubrivivax sp.]
MRTTYFDLTDVVQFADKNYRVTGIQRVQLRIIAEIAARFGTDQVKGIAYFDASRGWQQIDLSFMASNVEFDATRFLMQVGKLKPSRFPSRSQVRHHLARYADRKWLRGLHKAGIYLQAALWPQRLKRVYGFRIYDAASETAASCSEMRELHATDVLALLGANWDLHTTTELAIQHASRGGRVVQMIHDLIPYTHPELQTQEVVTAFNRWLEKTPQYVESYLCTSHFTSEALHGFLSKHSSTARVLISPLAHEFAGYPRNHQPGAAEQDFVERRISAPFVLCVGSIEIRKNCSRLLKAWQSIRNNPQLSTLRLVFAGKIAWRSEEFTELLASTDYVDGSVCIIESPSDAELAALYCNCLFTVYPSLQEGWGLPVGESAWFSSPILASTASSIPEVCGSLIDYMNPDSVDDMARCIMNALTSPGHLDRQRRVLQEAAMRTWGDVAENVFARVQPSSPGSVAP